MDDLFWLEYNAVTPDSPYGVCSLCGNSGIVDTTGVRSPRGHEVGRRNFCVCPNGRKSKELSPSR